MRSLTRSLLAAAAGLSAVSLSGCSPVDYSESYTVEEPVDRVVVQISEGHLELVGTEGDVVTVTRDVRGWESNLALETRVVDGTLTITATCEGVLRCQVDSVIELPARLDVDAVVDHGTLTATNLRGDADLSVGEGDLFAWSMAPTGGSANVGVGNLELDLLQEAPLSVAVGQGTMALAGETGALDVFGSR